MAQGPGGEPDRKQVFQQRADGSARNAHSAAEGRRADSERGQGARPGEAGAMSQAGRRMRGAGIPGGDLGWGHVDHSQTRTTSAVAAVHSEPEAGTG